MRVCPFWFAREEKGNPSCCDVVDVEKRKRDGIVEMKGQIECVDHSSKMWIDHCGKCANICKQPTLEMSDSWLEQTGCCCSGSFELTWEMDGVKGCRWFTLITATFMNEWMRKHDWRTHSFSNQWYTDKSTLNVCCLFVRCVSSLFMKKQTQETHCCLIGRDGFDMEMEEREGMGCVIDENERMRRWWEKSWVNWWMDEWVKTDTLDSLIHIGSWKWWNVFLCLTWNDFQCLSSFSNSHFFPSITLSLFSFPWAIQSVQKTRVPPPSLKQSPFYQMEMRRELLVFWRKQQMEGMWWLVLMLDLWWFKGLHVRWIEKEDLKCLIKELNWRDTRRTWGGNQMGVPQRWLDHNQWICMVCVYECDDWLIGDLNHHIPSHPLFLLHH